MEDIAREITLLLYDNGMIRTWLKDKPEGWKLHSGIWSPFYIQLRNISSQPNSQEILHKIGHAMGRIIKDKMPKTSKIVGVAMAGIPVAVAVTMCTGIPSCYTRSIMELRKLKDFDEIMKKLKKTYGEPTLVEGKIVDGDKLVIVDDLVTDFQSKLIAKAFVDYESAKRGVKVTCQNVAVLFDREQGAYLNAKSSGMNLFSLIPFRSKGIEWLRERISTKEYEIITDYLDKPEKYQNPEIQKDLESLAKNVNFRKGFREGHKI
jgi:orotate phosphoribosyltransferase